MSRQPLFSTSRPLGALLVTVGTFGGAVGQWVIAFVIARTSGAAEVGIFSSVLALAGPVFIFFSFALRDVYLSLSPTPAWTLLWRLRLLGSLAALTVLISAGYVLGWPLFLVGALATLKSVDLLIDLAYGRLQRHDRLVTLGILMCLNPVGSVAAIAVILLASSSLPVAIAGSAFVSGALLVVGLRSGPATEPHDGAGTGSLRVSTLRTVLQAGIPLTGAQLLSSLLVAAPIWLIALHGTPAQVGVYSVAAYVVTIGNLFGSSMATVLIPRLRRLRDVATAKDVLAAAVGTTLKIALLGAGACVPLALWGDRALQFMYGPEFSVGAFNLAILGIAATIGAAGYPGNSTLIILHTYRAQLIVNALAVLVIGALTHLVLPAFSPISAVAIGALGGAVVRCGGFWIVATLVARSRVTSTSSGT